MSAVPKLDAGHAGCRDVLKLAAAHIGWEVVLHTGASVVWVDHDREAETRLAARRSKGEWVSWIPGVPKLCGKIALAAALQACSSPFWPRTWNVPPATAQIISAEVFQNRTLASRATPTVIVKPDEGSQGSGIGLAQSRTELSRLINHLPSPGGAIVQEYVAEPLLLDNRKWDCRIYVLMIPLPGGGHACYLSTEGLVRVCLETYEAPSVANLSKTSIHLTNYSLNKFSAQFEHSDDAADATQGCKRTLSTVLQRLEEESGGQFSAEATWQALGALSRESADVISEQLMASVADLNKLQNCFHLLGLDVLLDSDGRPWLLEANHRPSLLVDEVHPVPGAAKYSRADINKLMAEQKSTGAEKWGKLCRCGSHPLLHSHQLSSVDVAAKLPAVAGALLVAHRSRRGGDAADWAEGTSYSLV